MPSFDIEKLLRPRSVAIVGASPRESATGFRVLNHLRKYGFRGEVYPINPRYDEVLGFKCYPSLAALPRAPDLVFAAVPAESSAKIVDEAGRLGVRAAIVNASGFADAGPEGQKRQDELVRIAEAHGIALCGPNNNGLMNFADNVVMSVPVPQDDPKVGPLAAISQSGSMSYLLSRDKAGIGVSCVISVGNEAVLTAAEYVDAIGRDERVSVIALFLETIRRPQRFVEAVGRATRQGKTVLAVKVGRTSVGRAAVQAHTGSIAGEDRLYDAFFRQCGVVRVDDLDEMVETAALFSRYQSPPSVPGIVPITTSGGQAAITADLGTRLGLQFPALSAETQQRLKKIYPPIWAPNNPLDAWALGFDVARFATTIEILAADPGVGVIVPVMEPRPYGNNRDTAEICAAVKAKTGRAVVFVNDSSGGDREPAVKAILDAAGIPYLSGVRNSLAAMVRWLKHRPAAAPPAVAAGLAERGRRFVQTSQEMSEPDRFAFLSSFGVPMAECRSVATADEAIEAARRLQYPVVLKGCAPDLAHKTEHGLVAVGLRTVDEVAQAFSALQAKLRQLSRSPHAAVIIQPQVKSGIELLLGVRNTPGFGSLVVVGLGGALVELLDDVSVRLGPVTPDMAIEMLHEMRAGTLLAGYRGRGPFDIEAAARAIAALSQLGAAAQESLAAIEVNPLIVGERGRGVLGVDVVVEPVKPGA